jgi:hypothetical protein
MYFVASVMHCNESLHDKEHQRACDKMCNVMHFGEKHMCKLENRQISDDTHIHFFHFYYITLLAEKMSVAQADDVTRKFQDVTLRYTCLHAR